MNGIVNAPGVTQPELNAVQATLNSHISHTGNPHGVTKAQVGLGKVDNTADKDKPVSTAQQTALNQKASAAAFNNHTTNKTVHITAVERDTWNAKQNALTFDTTPTAGSANPVTSGGVKAELDKKANSSHGTHVSFSSTAPAMDGTASVGSSGSCARADHRHPTDTSRAAINHKHNASDINSGTLDGNRLPVVPVSKGGLGTTSLTAARNSLGLGNTTGPVPIPNGGTGANNAADARKNLGVAAAAHNHDAVNITTGTLNENRLPVVPASKGGLGMTSLTAARNALGLGNTTGPVPIPNGGTGANNAVDALRNLGAFSASGGTISGNVSMTGNLTLKGSGNFGNQINFGDGDYVHIFEKTDDAMEIKATDIELVATNVNFNVSGSLTKNGSELALASHTHNLYEFTTGTLSSDRLPIVPVIKGGTGANTAAAARANLGAAATSHTHSASDITSGTLSSNRLPITPVTKGGTGATTAADALYNLGISIQSYTPSYLSNGKITLVYD